MNQKNIFAYQIQTPSLLPLRTVLKEAKLFSPPDTFKTQTDVDEELASKLIEEMKKQHRRPSPFANWMGQPFPHEYKEMVAADVR
jgi:hypothetical protein